MNCVILQKVVYRLPGTKRPVYAVVLGQNEDGNSLLFVRKPNGAQSHCLAFAVDAGKGYYEATKTSEFTLDRSALGCIGVRMQAVAGGLDDNDNELERMLEDLL